MQIVLNLRRYRVVRRLLLKSRMLAPNPKDGGTHFDLKARAGVCAYAASLYVGSTNDDVDYKDDDTEKTKDRYHTCG